MPTEYLQLSILQFPARDLMSKHNETAGSEFCQTPRKTATTPGHRKEQKSTLVSPSSSRRVLAVSHQALVTLVRYWLTKLPLSAATTRASDTQLHHAQRKRRGLRRAKKRFDKWMQMTLNGRHRDGLINCLYIHLFSKEALYFLALGLFLALPPAFSFLFVLISFDLLEATLALIILLTFCFSL